LVKKINKVIVKKIEELVHKTWMSPVLANVHWWYNFRMETMGKFEIKLGHPFMVPDLKCA
jgi:hypothetical protein